MPMIKELLSTDVGILSLLCILFMIGMSIWLWRWTKKKMDEDTVRHERLKKQSAQK